MIDIYILYKYKNIADFRSTLAGNKKVYTHTIEKATLGTLDLDYFA